MQNTTEPISNVQKSRDKYFNSNEAESDLLSVSFCGALT
ncbi:hypothetical protein DOT_0499 [Desulfosporosinus sp. OT]|nr:hypothetical protein DOT_0499 [Desulfosporosinus sp. OT]